MTSQQDMTELNDKESTKTVDVEVIDLGDAKVETRQAWFWHVPDYPFYRGYP